jgi:hypothetical protein
VRVELDRLTILIGANGTGKSSVLRALEFFFGQLDLDADDLHRGASSADSVEVQVCFEDLPEDVREQPPHYLEDDGSLIIGRRWQPGTTPRYFATARRIPAFSAVRNAGSASDAKRAYEKLREDGFALPTWTKKDEALRHLAEYEREHPEECVPEEDSCVGFGKAAQVDLGKSVRFLVVPAVKEATQEAIEARGNVFSELVREVVQSRADDQLRALQEQSARQYKNILQTHAAEDLERASSELSRRLKRFVPGAQVRLSWDTRQEPTFPSPRIAVQLGERQDMLNWVGRQGHGVQRAFLLALLTAIAEARRAEDSEGRRGPSLILAIEEPELYQHPPQARLFARALWDLGGIGGSRFQVVYTTHSPFFLSMDRADQIRLFRIGAHQATEVRRLDVGAVERRLNDLGRTGGLQKQLRLLMETQLAEAFFARKVVLVEGEEDRAYLLAAAEQAGLDLGGGEVAVIPAGGKSNLLVPLVVLEHCGIPVFVVFDTDSDKTRGDERERAARENRELLSALSRPAADFPRTEVWSRGAIFDPKMGTVIRQEVGAADFDTAVNTAVTAMGGGDAKNPLVLTEALKELQSNGKYSATLADLVGRLKTFAEVSSAEGGRARATRAGRYPYAHSLHQRSRSPACQWSLGRIVGLG